MGLATWVAIRPYNIHCHISTKLAGTNFASRRLKYLTISYCALQMETFAYVQGTETHMTILEFSKYDGADSRAPLFFNFLPFCWIKHKEYFQQLSIHLEQFKHLHQIVSQEILYSYICNDTLLSIRFALTAQVHSLIVFTWHLGPEHYYQD